MVRKMTFQEIVFSLSRYWADRDCLLLQPGDVESGAGTFHVGTFLGALTPYPWRAAFVSPARRPRDGRYGENPHRLYMHYQFQVILKPAPENVMEEYIGSLEALGIKLAEHDLRFDEDDWEAPTLGAWGLGWQVLLDGQEITQFTYFQQVGGYDLSLIPVELTYGFERIAMYLAGADDIYQVPYGEGPVGTLSYGALRREDEYEQTVYAMEAADPGTLFKLFELYEAECRRLNEADLIRPAHDYLLKCSHAFNLLDSRGLIGVTERAAYMGRVRTLSRSIAGRWLKRF